MQVDSIAEQLFFNTVRIDTIGLNGGAGAGTAFFFAYKRGDQHFPFVVANKHVVADVREGALWFLQRKDGEPSIGTGFRLRIDDWSNAWFGHQTPRST